MAARWRRRIRWIRFPFCHDRLGKSVKIFGDSTLLMFTNGSGGVKSQFLGLQASKSIFEINSTLTAPRRNAYCPELWPSLRRPACRGLFLFTFILAAILKTNSRQISAYFCIIFSTILKIWCLERLFGFFCFNFGSFYIDFFDQYYKILVFVIFS